MFASSFCFYVVAALCAGAFTGNVATAYVMSIPDGPSIEITQNVNSSEPISDMITYNGTHTFALDRNNLTVCPCSIIGYQVPNPSYLVDIVTCISSALILYSNNLQLFCQNLALLFLQIYILPGNKIWAICAGCQYCYNPGVTIWILIQLNLFNGITIKICN